jgi:hypothetical protein
MAKRAKTVKGGKRRKARKVAPKKIAVHRAAGSKKKKAKKKVAKTRVRKVAAARTQGVTPYRCVYTPQDGVCLKFMYNPTTRRYDLPPGGIRVSCDTCQYF